MSSVGVIVPWRGGCPHREAAWRYCESLYEWPVTLAPGGEPWIKALPVWSALERSNADVVIVADADVWTDGLGGAIEAVEAGAPWAVPHLLVHRLDQDGGPERRPYRGMAGGGYVIARREVLLDIPPDPRFVGWGGEDLAWGYALSTLAGPPWRGEADLIHYWHPLQDRRSHNSRRGGSEANTRLANRYHAARRDPEAMRTLIEESRVARNLAESPMHDRQAA